MSYTVTYVQSSPTSYLDIGHDAVAFQLWMYKRGKLYKTKTFPADSTACHLSEFMRPGKMLYDNTTYTGRFEPKTGRISIVRAWNRRFDDIPNTLMNELLRNFQIQDITVF